MSYREPNPILEAFREYERGSDEDGFCYEVWVDALDGVLDPAFDAYYLTLEARGRSTEKQVNHALRVLSRLSGLTGGR